MAGWQLFLRNTHSLKIWNFPQNSLLTNTLHIVLEFLPITNYTIFFHFVDSVNLNLKFNQEKCRELLQQRLAYIEAYGIFYLTSCYIEAKKSN